MVCDHPVAGLDVGSLKHDLDVFEWHIQVAEAADDLSRDDLLCGVPSVSGVPVCECRNKSGTRVEIKLVQGSQRRTDRDDWFLNYRQRAKRARRRRSGGMCASRRLVQAL